MSLDFDVAAVWSYFWSNDNTIHVINFYVTIIYMCTYYTCLLVCVINNQLAEPIA